jgi:hypothetical protein
MTNVGSMPFNSIISRADALLIPDDVAQDVIKAAAAQSAALSLFRQVNMGSQVTTMPLLSALAVAYFANGDIALIYRFQLREHRGRRRSSHHDRL